MYRKAQEYLDQWYSGDINKKPLLLRGARQVGKSTLVRNFCKEKKISLFEVNFEIDRLETLVSLQGFDYKKTIAEIEAKCRKKFDVKNSLIFFDEIQASPETVQALRYFYEAEENLAIVAAGSLLEFLLKDHNFSMPVGRIQFLHLGPMTFFEFLLAMGESELVLQLESLDVSVWQNHHSKLTQYLREFYFVGGMPEAVKAYQKSKNHEAVRRVHRSILQTYKNDFSKYRTKIDSVKISLVFEKMFSCFGKKIKYSSILSEEKSTTIAGILEFFSLAKIITKCFHTNASGLPLLSLKDESVFKIYFLDIGLLHFELGIDENDLLYENFNDEKNLITEGLSAEQFISQHLAYGLSIEDEPSLLFWLRDKKNENSEVDFVVSHRRNIIPIEVKSGKAGTIKSLIAFSALLKIKKAVRFDLKARSEDALVENVNSSISNQNSKWTAHFELINLPIYMAECLRPLLAHFEKRTKDR